MEDGDGYGGPVATSGYDRRVPDLSAHDAGTVALVACVVAALALLLAAWALLRLRSTRRQLAVLGAEGGHDVLTLMARQSAQVAEVRAETAAAMAEARRARAEVADSLRHVAVVRYDAFGDMGGRLSFSAALLDDGGDGVVLTSINGRSETRTYAKGVKAGASEHALSPEEEQAVSFARRGEGARR